MTRVDPDAGGHGTHRPLVVAVRHACALIVVFSVCMLQVLSASAAGAGNLDPSFGGDGTVTADLGGDDFVSHLVVRPDGTILVIGTTFIGDGATGKVMSLSSDGSTDTAFRTDGTV